MRIALITQEEPFYLPAALDAFCGTRGDQLVGMVILPSFNESIWKTARRLLEFYGPFDFCRLCRRFVWARILDQLDRFRPRGRAYSAGAVARRHGLPVWRPPNVNAAEFLDVLRTRVKPDLLVSIAASQIFRKPLLEIPPLGCINLHSAPLPKYQGMMPNFWTLVHGEPNAAVTVHMMAEKLDAGDILLQKPVEIRPADSLHDLMVRSKKIGVQALNEAIQLLEQGKANPVPMDTDQATYFSFPKREDAKRLRSQGRSLL